MANTNRFTIIDSVWEVDADGVTVGSSDSDIGSSFDASVDTWESLTTFSNEIPANRSSGTWDLGGRGFIADETMAYTGAPLLGLQAFDSDITIKNATFSGALERTWVGPDGNGVYYTDMPSGFNSDSKIFDGAVTLYDPAVGELPGPPLQSYQGTDLAGPSGEYQDQIEVSPYSKLPSYDYFIASSGGNNVNNTPRPCNPIMDVVAGGSTYEVLAFQSLGGGDDLDDVVAPFIDQGVRAGDGHLYVWDGSSWVDRGSTGYSQSVKGFKVTDPTMSSYLTSLASANGGIQNVTLQLWHSANVSKSALLESWDSGTGVLMLQTNASFVDAMSGVFSAPSLLSDENTAVYAAGENRVYYKPPAGVDPSNAVVSYLGRIWDNNNNSGVGGTGKVTFENCTFIGQLPTDNESGGINWQDRNGVSGAGGLKKCIFDTMDSASYRGVLDVDETIFRNIINLSLNVTSGSSVTRSQFKNPQRYECMRVQKLQDGGSGTVSQTTITDNIYYMPYSTHGQGLSLYLDSWQQSEVVGNIFYNCVRAMAFQPEYNSSNTQVGTMRFENNIIYWDKFNNPGQWGIANQSGDNNLSATPGQLTLFRYNSDIRGESPFAISPDNTKMQIYTMTNTDVYVESNVATIIDSPYPTSPNGGHYHKDNIFVTSGEGSHGSSYSSDDYGSNGQRFSWSDIKGTNTLELDPTFSGYGAQWESYPAVDSILSLPTNWRASYPLKALPAFDKADGDTWGQVYFNQDNRP